MREWKWTETIKYIWYGIDLAMTVILLHRSFPAFLLIGMTLLLAVLIRLRPAGFFSAGFWIALTPAFWGRGLRGWSIFSGRVSDESGGSLISRWQNAITQLPDGPYGRSGYSLVRRIIAPGVTNMWQLPEYAPEREYNLTAALLKSEMNLPEARILPWEVDPGFTAVVTVLLLWAGFFLSLYVVIRGIRICIRRSGKILFPSLVFGGFLIPVILYMTFPFSTVLDIRFYFWIPVGKALLCGIVGAEIAMKRSSGPEP